MTEISRKSLKMLRKINRMEYLPEDQIPEDFDRYRLQFLVDEKLITVFTLIPPGCEGYERGLVAYKLSPKGEDAIYNFMKVRREARIALLLSIASIVVAVISLFLR